MSKPLIIYHGDCNDGFGSALAAYLKLGDSADYFPGMYDGVVPYVKDRDVMIFDYHFKEPVLSKMKAEAKSLILKDHHASAQKLLEHLPYTFFDNSKSGAMLAWEHFFDEKAPDMFKWLQDRDLFENKYEESNLLHYYLNSKPYDLKVWAKTFHNLNIAEERKKILDSGLEIFNYFKIQMDLVIKHHAVEFELNGEKGWLINAGRLFASDIGNELAKINNSFAIIWNFTDKKKISCSVRSVGNSSAQAIAEKFGGGGHKHASKFVISAEDFFSKFLNKVI